MTKEVNEANLRHPHTALCATLSGAQQIPGISAQREPSTSLLLKVPFIVHSITTIIGKMLLTKGTVLMRIIPPISYLSKTDGYQPQHLIITEYPELPKQVKG